MKSILLGINFQNESDAAIEDAYLLATKYKATIIPIHAVEYLPQRNYQHEIDLLVKQIEERMLEIAQRLSLRSVNVCQPIIEKGDPIIVLNSAAVVLDVDLLIIGAGVNQPTHKTLGVTAKSIIRHAKVPVWVSNIASNKVDYKDIICAVDLSATSLTTLRAAASVAKVLNAKLHVIHIEPEVTFYPGLLNSEIPVSPWSLSSELKEMVNEETYNRQHENEVLNNEFKKFIENSQITGVQMDLHVRTGKASKEILAFIALFEAGLLVMGTTGKSTILEKLMGGTIEKILDRLPSTMLCIPYKKE